MFKSKLQKFGPRIALPERFSVAQRASYVLLVELARQTQVRIKPDYLWISPVGTGSLVLAPAMRLYRGGHGFTRVYCSASSFKKERATCRCVLEVGVLRLGG